MALQNDSDARPGGQKSANESHNQPSVYLDRGYNNYILANAEYQASNPSKAQPKGKQPGGQGPQVPPPFTSSAILSGQNSSSLIRTGGPDPQFEMMPHIKLQNKMPPTKLDKHERLTIHVFDENRQISRDFHCNKEHLKKYMLYF